MRLTRRTIVVSVIVIVLLPIIFLIGSYAHQVIFNPAKGDAKVLKQFIAENNLKLTYTINRHQDIDVSEPSYEQYFESPQMMDHIKDKLTAYMAGKGYEAEAKQYTYDPQCKIGHWSTPACEQKGLVATYNGGNFIGRNINDNQPYWIVAGTKSKSKFVAELTGRSYYGGPGGVNGLHELAPGTSAISIIFSRLSSN